MRPEKIKITSSDNIASSEASAYPASTFSAVGLKHGVSSGEALCCRNRDVGFISRELHGAFVQEMRIVCPTCKVAVKMSR